MTNVSINIYNIIESPSALTREQGEMIYSYIISELSNGNHVVLDFSGIESTITPFLNVSIGRLYETYTSSQLNDSIEFSNLPKGTDVKIKLVTENAKHYYLDKQTMTKIIEDVMNS